MPDLEVVSFALGPAVTNAYLVGESSTGTAIIIDPAWDGSRIVTEAERRGWRITQIWLTHAHFDHFGGAAEVSDAHQAPIPVALHEQDHSLWRMGGGAFAFGIPDFDPGPEPTIELKHGMQLQLGASSFAVRHTPGHTPGHVIFRNDTAKLMFCGDLIFRGSVGRTDLPGGNMDQLLESILEEVMTRPDEVRLLVGHGPDTTVGTERKTNPFLVKHS